jgi:hypothetical protein
MGGIIVLVVVAVVGWAHRAATAGQLCWPAEYTGLASFSGAASKTLKNLLPPGDTSKMLAMFPHLLRSDDSWKSEQATVTHL